MSVLKVACTFKFIKKLLIYKYRAKNISINVFGLSFKNPVGLGAGFDKNALYLAELETLGFGFVEIGTVTPLPQKGSDQPRLFRLPKDKALINRMGFNNDGVMVIARRLRQWKKLQSGFTTPRFITNSRLPQLSPGTLIIGGNIGKNKLTPNEDAWKDYVICFQEMFDCVDYFVVNVSSPNTPGLRQLQQRDQLQKIISELQQINQEKESPKPLLIKISPDLTKEEVDDVIQLSMELHLTGIVVANTTIGRDNLKTPAPGLVKIGAGGLSGKPLNRISTHLVEYISQKAGAGIVVIGSGGIFTVNDVMKKKEAGATLFQVWTGFIYEGPSIVKKICKTL